MTFALGGILVGLAVWYVQRRRRQPQTRISDQSLVRRHFSAPDASDVHGNDMETQRPGRRIRAFITMEQAINGIKTANSSETTLTNPDSRRSSNPYSKRNSWLTSSDPSIFDHAEFYEYDPETERQEKWRRMMRKTESVATFASSGSTLTSTPEELSKSEKHEAPASTGAATRLPVSKGRKPDPEPHGFKERLQHMFTPTPLTIVNPDSPDLDEGDFKGGVAFIGAMMAATTGGRAMAHCPVELPFDDDTSKLPEHWMPTTPQDA